MQESTVLFVDDQEEILFLIKRMLKEEPYRILFAKSGQEALNIIEKESVDVIVTDVLMPNMTGLELLDMVKDSHPNMVRIILSGFSQIPTLLSAINNGKIFRYITKPWQVDEEAKRIIRDAIDYSKLLKGNTLNTEMDLSKMISMDSFCQFLLERKTPFIVTVSDQVAYVHPDLKDYYETGEDYSEKVLGELTLRKEYQLSELQKVYLLD